jgi:hypothetical protein
MVSGTPIPVPKVDKADTEKFTKTVDDIHAQVVKQLQELYDRHKASYGEHYQQLHVFKAGAGPVRGLHPQVSSGEHRLILWARHAFAF